MCIRDRIRGVIGLRGKIIPIFDLAARMGFEPSRPGKIVIRRRDSPFVARVPALVVRLTELHWELHHRPQRAVSNARISDYHSGPSERMG